VLEPLNELQVVLVLALNQLHNINVFIQTLIFKGLLKNLKIAYKFVLGLCVPFYLGKFDGVLEVGVEQLAQNSPSSELLDLMEIQLKVSVYPIENFLSGNPVGVAHDSKAF
jgi:hypothetical protein